MQVPRANTARAAPMASLSLPRNVLDRRDHHDISSAGRTGGGGARVRPPRRGAAGRHHRNRRGCPPNGKAHRLNPPPLLNPIAAFFFNDPATTEIYPLSLHDALPISTSQYGSRGANGVIVITTKRARQEGPP